MKLSKFFIISIILITGLFFTLLLFPINAPFNLREVSKKIVKQGFESDSVSVGRVTIQGFKKVRFYDVVITGKEDKWQYNINIPTIVITVHPLKFLGNFKKSQLTIKNMLYDFRKIDYSLNPMLNFEKYLKEYANEFHKIKRVSIKSISINALNIEDNNRLVSDNTDITLSFSGKSNKLIEIKSDKAILFNRELFDANAVLSVKSRSVKLKRCTANMGKGSVSADALFSFKNNLLKKGSIVLENIKLEDLFRDKAYGIWKGKIKRINLNLIPSELITYDSIKGEGDILITGIKLIKTPVQIEAKKFLKTSLLDEITFNKISTPYSYNNNKITLKDLKSDGYPLSVKASGEIDILKKRQNLVVHGIFKNESSKYFKPLIWNTLIEEKEGRSFDCKIRGSYRFPILSFNIKFVGRAINNFFKTLFK